MRLFAIYIGGEHPAANIEVHDMRFVAAPSIEATHETLLAQWWGREGTLHIDCWSEISQADGYEISLLPEPYEGKEKLYYVNLGGYDGVAFAEQHRNVFVVADSLPAAKARAIKQATGWTDAHRDEMYEAEQAFALDDAAHAVRLHIHLKPSLLIGDPNFACHYTPIH
ncbi:DUF1543 domain-containing protein [Brevundimonas sp. G8]|uniref:DUF1543 domain-containing protein n=1 Tax=Brevundimonas sp. G8 TaxID=1350776 RepID=UPI0012F2E891|nr:DUF1543 domain-containing protein [Brevundimonas sp. G8]VXB27804.1 conserved hypothetical protein [Brevundimonas sp. G8]